MTTSKPFVYFALSPSHYCCCRFLRAKKLYEKVDQRVQALKRDEDGLKRKFKGHGIGFDFRVVQSIQAAAAHLATAVMVESARSAPLHHSQEAWAEAAAVAAAAAACAAGLSSAASSAAGSPAGSPSGASASGGGRGGGDATAQQLSPPITVRSHHAVAVPPPAAIIPASEVFAAAAAAARLRMSGGSDSGTEQPVVGGGAVGPGGAAAGSAAAAAPGVEAASPAAVQHLTPAEAVSQLRAEGGDGAVAGTASHGALGGLDAASADGAAQQRPRLRRWSQGGSASAAPAGPRGAVAGGASAPGVTAAAAAEHLAAVFKFAFSVHQFAGGFADVQARSSGAHIVLARQHECFCLIAPPTCQEGLAFETETCVNLSLL